MPPIKPNQYETNQFIESFTGDRFNEVYRPAFEAVQSMPPEAYDAKNITTYWVEHPNNPINLSEVGEDIKPDLILLSYRFKAPQDLTVGEISVQMKITEPVRGSEVIFDIAKLNERDITRLSINNLGHVEEKKLTSCFDEDFIDVKDTVELITQGLAGAAESH
jgi:hypothetical protein